MPKLSPYVRSLLVRLFAFVLAPALILGCGGGQNSPNVVVPIVNTAPSITTQPANQNVIVGQTATFTVVAAGTAPLLYQWQKNGASIPGGTSPAFTTAAITSADNGALFSVVVTNLAGFITSSSATLTVTPAALVSIAVTPTAASIAAGTAQGYTATGTFNNQTTQNLTNSVTWNSSTAATATIGAGGVATGANAGTTTITASQGGITSPGVTLTVTPATLVSIAVAPPTASIVAGGTQAYTATGTFSNQTTQNLTNTVTWNSSVTGTASINSSGLATGIAAGTTSISASFGGVTSPGVTLTVTSAVLVSIAVTPANASVVAGTTQAYIATGTFSNQTTQNLTNSVTWNSSTLSTASIDAGGVATGASAGTTTITAAQAGVTSPGVTLTVTPATLVSIAVTPANASIVAGTTQAYTATGTFSNQSTQNLTNSVTWNSSTLSTASINAAGVATGLASGTTTIAASQGSVVSPGVILTVNVLPSVTTNPTNQSVTAGDTATFTAIASGSPAPSVQWQVSTDGGATFINIVGATSVTLTFTTLTSQNGNEYDAIFTNVAGTVTTVAATLTVTPIHSGSGQFINLSPDGTHLVDANGKPVFLTGDSPQLIFTEISDEDIDIYLADRAARGFNVIWGIMVDNVFSSNSPHDFSGNVPFDGPDFTNFDPAYWAHVDSVINKAAALGITVIAMPGFVGNDASTGYFASFNSASAETMTAYGQFLGNRYKNFPNIIWVFGGDADPAQTAIYQNLNSLAAAIAATDPNHLATLEACRATCSGEADESSLDALSGPPSWLRLNWVYNKYATVIHGCQAAFAASPTFLPPLMGEDWYELEHGLTSFQVREEGYWEILSGCYTGRIFGNDSIWTLNSPTSVETPATWQSQLGSEGSVGQALMGQLFRSREHWKLQPDISHSVVTAGFGSGNNITTTSITSDGQSIIAYIPNGNATTLTVDMTKIISGNGLAICWWFNPSTGQATQIGSFANTGTQNFTAPDGNDWVLVIDAASANLPAPGSSNL